jgi:hypothetical protein
VSTAAVYSSTKPLQGKRVWRSDVIDRLLRAWPTIAVAMGAAALSVFGLAVGAAITFGLLAGCAIALAWTLATVPFARIRDGLTTYEIDSAGEQPPRGARRGATILMSRETLLWITAVHR